MDQATTPAPAVLPDAALARCRLVALATLRLADLVAELLPLARAAGEDARITLDIVEPGAADAPA